MKNHQDEGYIKFNLNWDKKPSFPLSSLAELIRVRDQMFREGLIGFDPGLQVGFGNISERIPGTDSFFISATQTGHIPQTGPGHYVRVISSNPEKNELSCEGPDKASSESMTHAAIYAALPDCKAVIHVHNSPAWKNAELPFTDSTVEYGTPEMASAVMKLVVKMLSENQDVFLMKGHKDGIVAFGNSLEAVADSLLKVIRKYSAQSKGTIE